MGTKTYNNYEDLLTFTRASGGHALRPVSYGTELVDDGTFDEGTVPSGWEINTANGVLSIVDGALQARDTNGDTYIADYELTNLKIGGIYKIEYTDSGVNTIALGSSRGDHSDIIDLPTTSGFNQVYVVATKSTHYFGFRRNNGITETIDNVSVKEVLFDQPDGTLTLFEHPENIPRVEYDADGNRLGLLVEEQRINTLTNSQPTAISSNFNGQAVTISFNQQSPTSTDEGMKITASATNDTHIGQWFNSVFSYPSGVETYTISVYVKDNTAGYALVSVRGGNPNIDVEKVINLSDGSIARNLNSTGEDEVIVEEAGNGWYRVSIVHTTDGDAGSAPTFKVGPHNGANSVSYLASGTESIYVFGAQFEVGSFPTSYIKTTGATATRSADVASIPVADFGYNQSEGTLFVEWKQSIGAASYVAMLSDGTATNRSMVRQFANGSAYYSTITNSVSQGDILTGTVVDNQSNKIGVVYKHNDAAGVLNGASAVTDATFLVPEGVSTLSIGSYTVGSSQYINGHIKSIQYYPRRLSNAQLVELTS